MVCATSKGSDQPAHTHSLIKAFASRFVKLLTEQHLEFLNLKGGCTSSSESIHVKMPHCWKSHVVAQNNILANLCNRVVCLQRFFSRHSPIIYSYMKNTSEKTMCIKRLASFCATMTNSVDQDQMLQNVASDQGHIC